jgi:transcriptional regulator with XRE-family HTH domain
MNMRYPNFLQIYRKRAKLTQIELAHMLGEGINRVIISNWEIGISCPPKEAKKKISEILGVKEKILFPL